MLLAAMVGFAVGLHSGSVLVALVLCVVSISLNQSQMAVGFVLTLLCTDLVLSRPSPAAPRASFRRSPPGFPRSRPSF